LDKRQKSSAIEAAEYLGVLPNATSDFPTKLEVLGFEEV
jgi:hypothetical protein